LQSQRGTRAALSLSLSIARGHEQRGGRARRRTHVGLKVRVINLSIRLERRRDWRVEASEIERKAGHDETRCSRAQHD